MPRTCFVSCITAPVDIRRGPESDSHCPSEHADSTDGAQFAKAVMASPIRSLGRLTSLGNSVHGRLTSFVVCSDAPMKLPTSFRPTRATHNDIMTTRQHDNTTTLGVSSRDPRPLAYFCCSAKITNEEGAYVKAGAMLPQGLHFWFLGLSFL